MSRSKLRYRSRLRGIDLSRSRYCKQFSNISSPIDIIHYVLIMNNEIALRTSKGEYLPGETVHGAVYLNICRPSEANGIRITFKGIETCTYEYECERKVTFGNETAHVDFSEVNLYTQEEYFQYGSYVFPFKFDLPKEIPGTFHCKGEANKTNWNVDVSYMLQAYAIGADSVKTYQTVIVYQAQEESLKQSPLGSAEDVSFKASKSLLSKTTVHVTAKLIENFVATGSNLQLRIVVTNQSKIKVTAFSVKLLRDLKLYVRDSTRDKKMLANMEFNDDICEIAPESGPHIVYSISGSSDAFMLGNTGVDRLQIPLREKSSGNWLDIPSTVVGKHVKNQYGLELAVTFSNGHTETIQMSVPGVLPKRNEQWMQWEAPRWTYYCQEKLSSSFFSVPQQLLRSEAFSGLPTFQVL